MNAAAQVLLARRTMWEVAGDYGVPYATVKRWVRAVRPHSDVMERVAHDFKAGIDPLLKAVLHHGVELGLLSKEEQEVAPVELAGGSPTTYRRLIAQLVTRHGGVLELQQAIRSEVERQERNGVDGSK